MVNYKEHDFHLDGHGGKWARRPIIVPDGPSIIVEGPDRVGKTTIVNRIKELTGIPSFKAPSEKQIFKDGGKSSLVFDFTLAHFLEQTGYRFVSDRAYPSEFVYSRVFGRETDFDALNAIDELHSKLGTKILFVYSSEEPTEKDDLVPDGMYWTVKNEYDRFDLWSDCRVYRVDTKDMIQAFKDGGDISLEVTQRILRDLEVID